MNNYKLYVHITPNGKRYYGITGQKTAKKRWRRGKGYRNNPYFTNAINKYGWDNIEHIILFDDLTEYEAKELEQYMIQWYDTANHKYGYNQTLGGEGTNGGKGSTYWKGKQIPEETRKKISETLKGNKLPEETKQKMSEKRKGKDNPRAKSVICITTKKIFLTAKDGANFYNIDNSHIIKCCKGKVKSAGKCNGQKLVWKYLNYKHNKNYRMV